MTSREPSPLPEAPGRRPFAPIFYFVGQIAAYGVDFGIFAVLVSAGAWPAIANIGAKVISSVVAFLFHRIVTFKATDRSSGRQAGRFFVLWLINLATTSPMIGVLSDVTGQPLICKIACDGAAFVINYFLIKRWVFATGH